VVSEAGYEQQWAEKEQGAAEEEEAESHLKTRARLHQQRWSTQQVRPLAGNSDGETSATAVAWGHD